ncbi:DinI-like family protein [Enterobacter ludwigii]
MSRDPPQRRGAARETALPLTPRRQFAGGHKAQVNVSKGSQSSLSVSGARNDREKADVMEALEAIWLDDSWLPL